MRLRCSVKRAAGRPAALWERMHGVDPPPAELAGIFDGSGELHGEYVANGFGGAIRRQNDETKPSSPGGGMSSFRQIDIHHSLGRGDRHCSSGRRN